MHPKSKLIHSPEIVRKLSRRAINLNSEANNLHNGANTLSSGLKTLWAGAIKIYGRAITLYGKVKTFCGETKKVLQKANDYGRKSITFLNGAINLPGKWKIFCAW